MCIKMPKNSTPKPSLEHRYHHVRIYYYYTVVMLVIRRVSTDLYESLSSI